MNIRSNYKNKIILINSIPKSGTHLLSSLLESNGYKPINFFLMGSLVEKQNFFKDLFFSIVQIIYRNFFECVPVSLDSERVYPLSFIKNKIFPKKNGKYFIYAHVPYSKKLDNFLHKNNIVVLNIVRDPRDIFLSFIDHVSIDRSFYLHKFFKKNYITNNKRHSIKKIIFGHKVLNQIKLAPFRERAKKILSWSYSSNSIIFKYEDFHNSNHDKQKKKFLFDAFNSNQIKLKNFNFINQNSKTYNKGIANRWKIELTKDDINLIQLNLNDICIFNAKGYFYLGVN